MAMTEDPVTTKSGNSALMWALNSGAVALATNDWLQGFVFNKHWLLWVGYLIVFNSVNIMTSVRSIVHERQISPLWVVVIHLSGLIPLLISTYHLFQDSLQFQYDTILTNLLLSLFWSNIVETFYTMTANLAQFNNHNITFKNDIIPLLYILKFRNVKKPFGVEVWYLLLTRFVIHGLELCEKREWLLPIDSFINCLLIISYTLVFDYKATNYPEYISRIFIFPKLLAMSYCLVSQLIYWCGISDHSVWGLCQDHWRKYQTKSFQEFIVTLAIKHASHGTTTIPNTKNDDDDNIDNQNNTSLHKYSISGYLNQYVAFPKWDEYNKDEIETKKANNSTSTRELYKSRSLKGRYTLISAYISLITLISWVNFNVINYLKDKILQRNKSSSKDSLLHQDQPYSNKLKDLNRLITKKNYSKFLLRPENNNPAQDITNGKKLSYLLPNFDSSKDYSPSVNPNDKLYDTEDWARKQEEAVSSQDDEEEGITLHDELWQLLLSFNHSNPTELDPSLSNEDLMWQISMWSLLRHQIVEDKRLTRSQYANESGKELVSEVMMEQRFNVPITNDEEEGEVGDADKHLFCDPEADNDASDNGNDDEISDALICPLCQQHPRNVILWPCQCLAVCDDCRLHLGHRAIKNCISCEREVEGYSKVNFV